MNRDRQMEIEQIRHPLEEVAYARDEAEVAHLYARWVEASAAEDRILQLCEEGKATVADVRNAHQVAEAAWQPYRAARAKLSASSTEKGPA